MRRLLLALTLSFSLAAPGLHAQEPAPGTRVRVSATDPALRRSVLIVQSVRGDTLHALLQGEPIAVPLAAATRVEVSQGRHRHRWRWAAIGALAGTAASFAYVGSVSASSSGGEDPAVILGVFVIAPALIAGGTVTGAVAAPSTEDWRTMVLGGPGSFRRGTRVRVWADAPELAGAAMTIDTVRGGVYLLSRGGTVTEVPIASVTRMEVWQGGASRTVTTLRGAAAGSLAGAAYGLVAISVSDPIEESTSVIVSRTTVLGGIVGALLGAARPGGHWRPAPNARLAVARAAAGGTRLGIDVRF